MNNFDDTTKKLFDYMAVETLRREIVSKNRSIRMSNMQNGTKIPYLPVPELPEKPKRRTAFEPDGTYYGTLRDDEGVPEGYKVKLVPATW